MNAEETLAAIRTTAEEIRDIAYQMDDYWARRDGYPIPDAAVLSPVLAQLQALKRRLEQIGSDAIQDRL
jgi:hypothetical protein